MDRCLTRAECEMCFRSKTLDELIHLQITSADDTRMLDDRRLCYRCKDYVVGYWFAVDETLNRYYRPA